MPNFSTFLAFLLILAMIPLHAPVAQWIERLASDQEVAGSSPARREAYKDVLKVFSLGVV